MNRDSQNLEEIYQKKSQIEHILLRPDSYIGSVELTEQEMWILPEGSDHMVYKKIEYVPGLYKIFDEILVNAADNYQRTPRTTTISVTIDQEKGFISVENDGKGIPVEMHKVEKKYIPDLLFGDLLSGSNFNDDQKKVTGGRNGYGAKLANIYSKEFYIECQDQKRQKCMKIKWWNNMGDQTEPKIIQGKYSKDKTKVSFYPDLKRFSLKKFTDDIIALFRKRVLDVAGVLSGNVKVFLNKEYIKVKSFQSYVDRYLPNNTDKSILKLHFKQPRWEIVLTPSEGDFDQVSFVNAICTTRGGTHVNYMTTQILNSLLKEITKKKPKLASIVKPYMIKSQFRLFLNCQIENPAFDSQTKETLTSKSSNFGSKCTLSKSFLKELLASDILERIIFAAELKEQKAFAKKLQGTKKTRLLGIDKLEDANEAGRKKSHKCLLILTEGDSAKSLAMAGLEVVGRDTFGVFPLRGKVLNVRDAAKGKIMQNREIQDLIKILGLKIGKEYVDLDELRYGGIMIMTDQDVDGSHIKGLLINLFAHFWPSLLKNFTFVTQFITPIIKCFKGTQVHSFFTLQEYKEWARTQDIKKWRVKYYKGLGTSTNEEGKEYFELFESHKIDFRYQDQVDLDKIDLLFNKKRADERKEWLKDYQPDDVIDCSQREVLYREFIDKELIHFSMYDNQRSIPSLVDGLKPGQRKILYACFLKNLQSEIKVAQLSGFVSEKAAYHHGEQSLHQTIIGLAQNFVGSNNLNLLMPNGQFGSRSMGGKDAASARYIHTSLSKATRLLFPEPDDHSLKYLIDDGDLVEPEYYIPILPLVLINGAEGIGTGWSTFVPNFDITDIAKNILRKLDGQDFIQMTASYKNFKGKIIQTDKGFETRGKYELSLQTNTLRITELPIGVWTRKIPHHRLRRLRNLASSGQSS